MAVLDMYLTFATCLTRGQSPLHILGQYGKENAAAIFDLFLECMPEYPLDKPDTEGNTGKGKGRAVSHTQASWRNRVLSPAVSV